MTEEEVRHVELLRAVEVEDREATILTREDLGLAEAHARSASAPYKSQRAAEAYVALRAEFATARLATRHPGVADLLRRSRWPSWVGLALPLLALLAGFAANEFGTSRRLDLLALPLLGTIAWNVLVYVWVAGGVFRRKGPRSFDPLRDVVARVAAGRHRDLGAGTPLHRAAIAFEGRWAKATEPLVGARIARTLHLCAALFAIGVIAGIYLRALVIEYHAGWESTFLGPTAVHALLATVLGPASWVTGITIPGSEGIAAMRWIGSDTGGVNAGPWIVLYTATVAGLVIVPRAALAMWQGATVLRLSRNFPTAGREDFYIRRLLRNAGGGPGTARITPYAYRPGEETQRRLSAALRGALGDGAEVRFDEPIEYGDEDLWLTEHVSDPRDDYHILLFTLSATPEEENHGALTKALAQRLKRDYPGTLLSAIIDESPFRGHFAGQPGLDQRVASRQDAWSKALSPSGLAPLALDLSHDVDGSLAQRLESGLLPDGAMRG